MYKNYVKRIVDVIVAIIALIFVSWILILTFLILYFTNKRKVFFKQERPGKNGKIFKIIKFKTMNDRKDKNGKLLPDNERITKFGNLIRKTSIDEIPQLFNVFVGDMGIIGPRPLLVSYLSLYSKEQLKRHDVRPGITGWAQINGRNSISWEDKFNLDVWYIDNLTFLLDLKIFFVTLKKVFFREGISKNATVTMEIFKGNQ
jgi:lipopolysaccharide/colanic/teichoic acid biosynthesis glycosyltransferase